MFFSFHRLRSLLCKGLSQATTLHSMHQWPSFSSVRRESNQISFSPRTMLALLLRSVRSSTDYLLLSSWQRLASDCFLLRNCSSAWDIDSTSSQGERPKKRLGNRLCVTPSVGVMLCLSKKSSCSSDDLRSSQGDVAWRLWRLSVTALAIAAWM